MAAEVVVPEELHQIPLVGLQLQVIFQDHRLQKLVAEAELQEDLEDRMEVLSDDEGWKDDDEGWPRHDPIRPQDLWTTAGRKQYQDEHADAVNLGGWEYGGVGMQIPMRARLEAEKLAD